MHHGYASLTLTGGRPPDMSWMVRTGEGTSGVHFSQVHTEDAGATVCADELPAEIEKVRFPNGVAWTQRGGSRLRAKSLPEDSSTGRPRLTRPVSRSRR